VLNLQNSDPSKEAAGTMHKIGGFDFFFTALEDCSINSFNTAVGVNTVKQEKLISLLPKIIG
jgi:hypothetical protein